jgi:hypothetical protein
MSPPPPSADIFSRENSFPFSHFFRFASTFAPKKIKRRIFGHFDDKRRRRRRRRRKCRFLSQMIIFAIFLIK